VNKSDGEIAKIVEKIFDMRPAFLIKRLKLKEPIYSEAAAYGHMGRSPEVKQVIFKGSNGEEVKKVVETFTWEKLDYVDQVKEAFGL